MRWVPSLLFESTPAEFASIFTMDDAVERLRSASNSWFSISGVFEQRAVGTVRSDRVRLERVRPFIRNDFKPQFVGHFVQSDGRVLLVGRFTMRRWTKIFMSIWLGFCLLWTAGATVATLAQRDTPGILPLAGLGMFAFGSLLVSVGKSWARSDVLWLSEVIRKALSGAT
jgi:hypothetical protein